jgi:hypothetical protein
LATIFHKLDSKVYIHVPWPTYNKKASDFMHVCRRKHNTFFNPIWLKIIRLQNRVTEYNRINSYYTYISAFEEVYILIILARKRSSRMIDWRNVIVCVRVEIVLVLIKSSRTCEQMWSSIYRVAFPTITLLEYHLSFFWHV